MKQSNAYKNDRNGINLFHLLCKIANNINDAQ